MSSRAIDNQVNVVRLFLRSYVASINQYRTVVGSNPLFVLKELAQGLEQHCPVRIPAEPCSDVAQRTVINSFGQKSVIIKVRDCHANILVVLAKHRPPKHSADYSNVVLRNLVSTVLFSCML